MGPRPRLCPGTAQPSSGQQQRAGMGVRWDRGRSPAPTSFRKSGGPGRQHDGHVWSQSLQSTFVLTSGCHRRVQIDGLGHS